MTDLFFKLARTQILKKYPCRLLFGKADIQKIIHVCNKLLLLLLTDRHGNSSNTIYNYVGIKTDTAAYDVLRYLM